MSTPAIYWRNWMTVNWWLTWKRHAPKLVASKPI